MEERVGFSISLLLLLLLPFVNTKCYVGYDDTFINQQSMVLYRKLEEALINNSQLLGDLRAGFISGEYTDVSFNLIVELKGFNDNCVYEPGTNFAFCPSPQQMSWTLCGGRAMIGFSTETQLEGEMNNYIIWLSLLHGSINILVPFFYSYSNPFALGVEFGDENYTLTIDQLDCNPSVLQTKCVLLELFSWVG